MRTVWGALRLGLTVVLLCPLFALGVSTVIDRGPEGPRFTAFYLGVTLSDPLARECLWNSLTLATAVALASLILGILLARVLADWRFWGRGVLTRLLWSPLVVPPMFAALGLVTLAPQINAYWPDAGKPLNSTSWLWGVWFWVEFAWGLAYVSRATSEVLSKTNPTWMDTAVISGSSRRKAWWTILFPLVRTKALRASAEVFALTLIEPGVPLVIGERRSLGYMLVNDLLDSRSPLNRPAILALVALVIGLGVRFLLSKRKRHVTLLAHSRFRRASWSRAIVIWTIAGAWSLLVALPWLALLAGAMGLSESDSWADVQTSLIASSREILRSRPFHRVAVQSIGLGLIVASFGSVLALMFAQSTPPESGGPTRLTRLLESLRSISPVVYATGLLCFPEMLRAGGVLLERIGLPSLGLRTLSIWLSPYPTALHLLIWALVVAKLPDLISAAQFSRTEHRTDSIELAISLGSTVPRSLPLTRVLQKMIGVAILVMGLTTMECGATLVLGQSTEVSLLGPAVLAAFESPSGRPGYLMMAALGVFLGLITGGPFLPISLPRRPRTPSLAVRIN